MNELEIMIVLRYIEEYLFEPEKTWPEAIFEERTYSRWAAYEIVHRLTDYPFDPPDEIVEAFILELLKYSYISKNQEASKMFSIAKDTAEDILCLFL